MMFLRLSLATRCACFDEIWLVATIKRELKKRFTKAESRGAVLYAVLRSTQLRRMRLPKPAIEIGQPLREQY